MLTMVTANIEPMPHRNIISKIWYSFFPEKRYCLNIITDRPGVIIGMRGKLIYQYTDIIKTEIPEIVEIKITEIENFVRY
jgi:ribosomal protein S3